MWEKFESEVEGVAFLEDRFLTMLKYVPAALTSSYLSCCTYLLGYSIFLWRSEKRIKNTKVVMIGLFWQNSSYCAVPTYFPILFFSTLDEFKKNHVSAGF